MPKQAVKPIFPLKHEFFESLNRYVGEVSMLVSMVETLVDSDLTTIPEVLRNNLRVRIDALRAATHD